MINKAVIKDFDACKLKADGINILISIIVTRYRVVEKYEVDVNGKISWWILIRWGDGGINRD